MKNRRSHCNTISLQELKIIQMDILEALDEYCTINRIRYSLACGTLLGAIRHKGYIPWDDDIDVYIPREDYKKLIDSFPEVYRGKYKLASLERTPQWESPYAKLYDSRTFMEEYASVKENIGVNIDVFPVDEVPVGQEWEKYNKSRLRLVKFHSLMSVKIDKSRSFSKNFVIFWVKAIKIFLPARFWAKKIDAKAQQFNGQGRNHLFETCQGIMKKHPFKKELFDNIVSIPFEDRFFKAFKDSDSYLRNGFGDYMKLPPVEKQVSHHPFYAYWK